MSRVTEYTAITIGITCRDIGQNGITFKGIGSVISDGVSFGVMVYRRDGGFKCHDAFVFGAGDGIAIKNTANTDHVEPGFRNGQGGERIRDMQGDIFAFKPGNFQYLGRLLIETGQIASNHRSIFFREMRHDANNFQAG